MSSTISTRWLPFRRGSSSAVARLFCFPFAGAGAALFRSWSARLPSGIDVCPVELPGRGQRMHEPAFDRLIPLVESAGPALAPYLDRPFAFFGHSLGALLAFELTRFLRRHGWPQPIHLFVSGCRAPQMRDQDPHLHLLPDRDFVEQLRILGGTPPEVLENRELLEIILPFVRADFAVCETYEYAAAPPLQVPITAIGGRDDGMVTEATLAAWSEQTTAPFRLRILPGAHFFLQEDEAAVVEFLGGELATATGGRMLLDEGNGNGGRMRSPAGGPGSQRESVL